MGSVTSVESVLGKKCKMFYAFFKCKMFSKILPYFASLTENILRLISYVKIFSYKINMIKCENIFLKIFYFEANGVKNSKTTTNSTRKTLQVDAAKM